MLLSSTRLKKLSSGIVGHGQVLLQLGGQQVPVALDWLPGEQIVACDIGRDEVDLVTASGMQLHMCVEEIEGIIYWRGIVKGLPDIAPAPMPTDSILSRDFTAGGLCLLRAQAPLAATDAYQRPRWYAEGWTVEFLTLDARVGAMREKTASDSSVIDVLLYPPQRGHSAGVPFAFTLLAAPDDDFTPAWRALAQREGLPGAHKPEDRDKVLRIARRPTLFTLAANTHTGPRLIEWAVRAGFGSILLHSPIWTSSDAHYLPNEQNWPGGWPALRAFVDLAREHGVAIGLHTMTTSIADHDPYVTPVPHDGLLVTWTTVLAHDISATETTLPLADPPNGLSTRDDYMSYGMSVRIGQEIIRYGALATEACTLTDCRRGAYGTQPSAHTRGERVDYLFRLYGEFAVDPESSLADEVAGNLARAFQETGAEMVYFDDSEAVPEPYYGHVSRYHEKLWRAIGLPHLHVQASSSGHFGQYMLARVGQQDTVIYKRALLDRVIVPNVQQYLAGDLVPDFGWFGVVFGNYDRDTTSVDDIDCLMARTLGYGAGVTIFGEPELIGTPLFQQIAQRLARWHAVRESLDAQTRTAFATPGREFRPMLVAEQQRVLESLPWRERLQTDANGAVQFTVDNPGPQQPLGVHITLRAPLARRGEEGNLLLFTPSVTPISAVDGAAAQVSVDGTHAVLHWQQHSENFTRWRVVFPHPVNLSHHRALSLRYRLHGACDAAVARLLTGLGQWITSMDFALSVSPGETFTVDDPRVDPELRFTKHWPDNWFSSYIGIDFTRVEGLDIVLAGVQGTGAIILESIEALQEIPPSGHWGMTLQAGGSPALKKMIPWDGSLTMQPEGDGMAVDIHERSGALAGSWRYDIAEMPVLEHGANVCRIFGLPPNARLDIRIDRLLQQ